jgi:hypothetical protein
MQAYRDLAKPRSSAVFDWAGSADKYSDMKGQLSIKEGTDFLEQSNVLISPFAFWLLQDQDPMGYGEVISPKVNHRRTNQTVFAGTHEKTERTATQMLRGSSTAADQQWLQNGVVVSMPYLLSSGKDAPDPTAKVSSYSTTTFHWRGDSGFKHNVSIEVKGLAIKRPDYAVYQALSAFFGYHLDVPKQRIGAYEDRVDFTRLMARISNARVNSVTALNDVLRSMEFPFRYNETLTSKRTSTVLAFQHFAAFFRFVTPLRLAQLEGGHRTFILNRVLQGYDAGKSTVPLNWTSFNDDRTYDDFPESGSLVSDLPMRLIYLHSEAKRSSEQKIKFGLYRHMIPGDFVQAIAYSKNTQDFRLETYEDTFPQILRNAVLRIGADGGVPYFTTDRDYWTKHISVFFSKKEVTSIGMHMSRCLGILLDELYSSRFFKSDHSIPAAKKSALREEAFDLFVPDVKGSSKLFTKKVIKAPFPDDATKLHTTAYYARHLSPSLKSSNQYYWPLWVSVWLVKTSLVRFSTFTALQDFLGKPSVQPILDVRWIHDSIIIPVEILVKHYVESVIKPTVVDKRRWKLVAYYKALFLEHYLTSLSTLKQIPLPYLDTDPVGAAQEEARRTVLDDVKNADVRHLIGQQETAKRGADNFPAPYLSTLCILYALHIRVTVPASRLDITVFQNIDAASGCKSNVLIGDDQLLQSININPHTDDLLTLATFIAKKSSTTSDDIIQVYAPPTNPSKRKSEVENANTTKKIKSKISKDSFVEIITNINAILSCDSKAKSVLEIKESTKKYLEEYKGLLNLALASIDGEPSGTLVSIQDGRFSHPYLDDSE